MMDEKQLIIVSESGTKCANACVYICVIVSFVTETLNFTLHANPIAICVTVRVLRCQIEVTSKD
jgi:hypothetical protein